MIWKISEKAELTTLQQQKFTAQNLQQQKFATQSKSSIKLRSSLRSFPTLLLVPPLLS